MGEATGRDERRLVGERLFQAFGALSESGGPEGGGKAIARTGGVEGPDGKTGDFPVDGGGEEPGGSPTASEENKTGTEAVEKPEAFVLVVGVGDEEEFFLTDLDDAGIGKGFADGTNRFCGAFPEHEPEVWVHGDDDVCPPCDIECLPGGSPGGGVGEAEGTEVKDPRTGNEGFGGGITVNPGIGAGMAKEGKVPLPIRIHGDKRESGPGIGGALDSAGIDSFRVEGANEEIAEGVVSNAGDHGGPGPEAAGADGYIGGGAAGAFVEAWGLGKGLSGLGGDKIDEKFTEAKQVEGFHEEFRDGLELSEG